jgi:glutamyl-tRNA reductase
VLGGRTFEKAEQLDASLGGRAAPFESLCAELARADIVISGTGAPGIVVRREDVEAAQELRHGRPLFLIDIAVPRDIAEDAGHATGVFLYDIDDLQKVAAANLRERKKESAAAEATSSRRCATSPRAPLARGGRSSPSCGGAPTRSKGRDRQGAPAVGPAHARAGERARGGHPRRS